MWKTNTWSQNAEVFKLASKTTATAERELCYCVSFYPHIRSKQTASKCMDFRDILYWGFLVKSVDTFRFVLKSDNSKTRYLKNYSRVSSLTVVRLDNWVFSVRYVLRAKTSLSNLKCSLWGTHRRHRFCNSVLCEVRAEGKDTVINFMFPVRYDPRLRK
jgi:hypothetical protein